VFIVNPKAVHPLPDEWFGAALQEELIDGKTATTWKEPFMPYSSMTQILRGMSKKKFEAHAQELWGEFTKVHKE
jgi:hypothetical protein